MLLVPRQLLRSGMTGNVPYYGGRLTPAQAWAASQPTAAPMRSPAAGAAVGAQPPAAAEVKAALDHLRESGVLTATEYDELLRRVDR